MEVHGRKTMAQLVFLASFKDTIDKCGVCKSRASLGLAYWLSDSVQKVYEAYNAIELSTHAHVYHGTLPVVITPSFNVSSPKTRSQKHMI